MLSLLRWVWKLLILGSAFGIGYIIGREHSFEEEEEWENEENDSEKKSDESTGSSDEKKQVTFEHSGENIQSVSVVGDFNDWNKESNPMAVEGNIWKAAVSLKPGRHEYKFVVNNTDWITDPKCSETVADKFGSKSSVIIA
ncbi:MAG: isoamylase early set domain-containing protein [Candidatus Riflebacteria bacterium]|nr:isoamylase early set domain-containing protein [Candidatus Riflebacteria bacterium]